MRCIDHRVIAGVVLALAAAWVETAETPVDRAVRDLEIEAGSAIHFRRAAETGLVRFFSTAKGIEISGGENPAARSLLFLDRHGAAFGLDRAHAVITRMTPETRTGLDHVRIQQTIGGIQVTGGEVMIHLRGDRVVAVAAHTASDAESVTGVPTLNSGAALETAEKVLAKHLGITGAEISQPRLEILNQSLLDGGPWRPSRLAWFLEARTFDRLDYLWIDAMTGALLLRFNQMPTALYREMADSESTDAYPGITVRVEGDADTGDLDADLGYEYVGDTHDFYFENFGRDSYDDEGAPLLSTVHYCPSPGDCPWGNAIWNGQRMVFGEGYTAADDVVAHELTHAVTQWTARLFYYMQSGALNESFSDIFGEAVDLANGNNQPGDKWLLGEDLPDGRIRDLWSPNNTSQPASMSDIDNFYCETPGGDLGGVHFNSGVPNRAFALMVDGDGANITGIGLTKAILIHYELLTNYLWSSSDFADYYNNMVFTCAELIGNAGITADDCTEVEEAMREVEIDQPWPCWPEQSAEPDFCGQHEEASLIFYDDVDSSMGVGWGVVTWNQEDSNCKWWINNDFASSGERSLWGPDSHRTCMTDIRRTTGIAIPEGGAKLRIRHSFGFEDALPDYFDGGFIVYSTDFGANWSVADCSTCEGAAYKGSIATGTGNAMAGVTGFVADSFGYAVTQLDLTPFAGENLRLGFRVSSDLSFADLGWYVDDIHIFECLLITGIFSDGFESGDTSLWSSAVGGP